MKICFSTLGCTEKPLAEALSLARANGAEGIELRGLSGVTDNAAIPEFRTENMAETARIFAESGVKPIVLGTSCMFHTSEKAAAALAEGECSIRIAQQLGIPYIRVFGNNIVEERDACIARVSAGISQLCSKASHDGVTVLLEVHGDFNTVETLSPVLEALREVPNFGLIWDICHTHAPYGMDWLRFYETMRPYIRHVHIKDKAANELVLPGDGEIPIREIIGRMTADGYDGYFSLEWERKWHPELPDIEIALERYINLMKG